MFFFFQCYECWFVSTSRNWLGLDSFRHPLWVVWTQALSSLSLSFVSFERIWSGFSDMVTCFTPQTRVRIVKFYKLDLFYILLPSLAHFGTSLLSLEALQKWILKQETNSNISLLLLWWDQMAEDRSLVCSGPWKFNPYNLTLYLGIGYNWGGLDPHTMWMNGITHGS